MSPQAESLKTRAIMRRANQPRTDRDITMKIVWGILFLHLFARYLSYWVWYSVILMGSDSTGTSVVIWLPFTATPLRRECNCDTAQLNIRNDSYDALPARGTGGERKEGGVTAVWFRIIGSGWLCTALSMAVALSFDPKSILVGNNPKGTGERWCLWYSGLCTVCVGW